MTIQEAIREVEQTIEGGRALEKEIGNALPGHDRYLDLMETLLAAARKGAAEELQAEQDELIKRCQELTMETVTQAIGSFEEVIRDTAAGNLCMLSGTDRFGMVIEPAMHTALAALRKVQLDLASDGIDDEASPRVRVVHVKNTDKKSMEEILKQVEGDLEKIFAEQEAK